MMTNYEVSKPQMEYLQRLGYLTMTLITKGYYIKMWEAKFLDGFRLELGKDNRYSFKIISRKILKQSIFPELEIYQILIDMKKEVDDV